ncbi:hypothetical protein R5R35_005284 [Gryllus longicercus]|uniref:Trissin n=2 Tax=Gryllus longicercus TaxID=2509291 RepID=A0AAN9VTR1_9ORTH
MDGHRVGVARQLRRPVADPGRSSSAGRTTRRPRESSDNRRPARSPPATMVHLSHFATLLSGLLLLAALGRLGGADACDICGRECMGSCGDTRTFVTCCYNYLRKRGVGPVGTAPLGLAPLAAAASDYAGPAPPPPALRPRAAAFHLRPPSPPAAAAAVALYDD